MRVRTPAYAFQAPNLSKPRIPLPPALPRFVLPNDPNATGELDVSDSAQTTERRAVSATAARRIVRKRVTPQPSRVLEPNGTEEVLVQDILLEAYLEDPPPPSKPMPPPPNEPAAFEPPRPSQGRAVDALLRTSDPGVPALASPPEPRSPGPMSSSFPATSYEVPPRSSAYVPVLPAPAEHESPSVAPVAFGSYSSAMAMVSPAPEPAASLPPPAKRTNVLAIFAVVMLVFGASAFGGALLAMPKGTAERWASKAKEMTSRKSAPSVVTAPVAAAPPAASAPSVVTAPPAAAIVASTSAASSASVTSPAASPAASTPAPPTVSIDALQPKGGIHPKTTLVVFPESARGHRIWVDGTMVTASEKPTMLKCGHRKIQIGSAGKLRKIDLPCGKQIVLDE
ncbi:MAG: hypothetical protein JST00_45755 [Deltaproteobacteria bacterium]|nr:hypothetical protein [Deltaproteobacteria bacterium]